MHTVNFDWNKIDDDVNNPIPAYKFVLLYSEDYEKDHPETKGVVIGYCDYKPGDKDTVRRFIHLGIDMHYDFSHWALLPEHSEMVKNKDEPIPINVQVLLFSEAMAKSLIQTNGIIIGKKVVNLGNHRYYYVDEFDVKMYWEFSGWCLITNPKS